MSDSNVPAQKTSVLSKSDAKSGVTLESEPDIIERLQENTERSTIKAELESKIRQHGGDPIQASARKENETVIHSKLLPVCTKNSNDAKTYPSKDETLVTNAEGDAFLLLNSGNGLDEIDALPSNLRYSNFDLMYTLISVLTYLFDLFMDCAVAYYFYHLAAEHGIYHYWYFGLTVTFVLVPSLTMTGFSLRYVSSLLGVMY